MTTNERAPEGDRSYSAVRGRAAMPLDEAMETQRAVRRVLPDPVDDDIVLRCIELALRAPTGSNGQNWEFVIVKDLATKAAFGERYREAWTAYPGRGSAVDAAVTAAVDWQVEHFEEIPVIVVACLGPGSGGDTAPTAADPPIQVASFYGSIFPSVQNLLLAARSFGLGASLITLPLWSTSHARRVLELPETVTPICMVPMGWPRGRYGPTRRRPVGEVTHLDRFGRRPWLNGRDSGEPNP